MLVGGLVVSACGCWILYGLLSQFVNAARSRHWTGRATGIVVQRGMKRLEFPGQRHERRAFEVAALEYEYEVAGETYRSRNVAFTPYRGGHESRRGRFIATLEPGQPIDVVYNESRPREAVLHPGFAPMEVGGVLFGLFAAALFLGVGSAMLLGLAG
ncbi:hypothetical protein Mal4_52880 [Maioricimonas rarisocia]|uniref:DUF3592 domain-containing protein n=2 Tax=Maioricimonas rarisocia TaxID=2528026 RepID=A0A517ZEK1_9PLAN|nr:hypothetical protein Mal4_52880 [Maioricimonas rarisocia]